MGYWQRSPLSLVGNVKTPTIVVVGSEDYRTPDSEAEQFYEALQLRNVPTMLVKVPGAGRIAGRPTEPIRCESKRDPCVVRSLSNTQKFRFDRRSEVTRSFRPSRTIEHSELCRTNCWAF